MLRDFIQKYFKLSEQHLTIRGEIIAGLTTFFTMSYIIVVNPMILSSVGMNYGAVFVATCLAAAFGSIFMGFIANYPLALAPTMSLNTYFAYIIVQHMGYSWQIALGTVFIAGVTFGILTLFGVRQWLITLVPTSLKISISAGIGLFLGVIALKSIGIVSLNPMPTIEFSAFLTTDVYLTLGGLTLITIFGYFRILGGILLGMLVITAIGVLIGVTTINQVVALPPSMMPTLFALELPPLNSDLTMAIGVFLFAAFFDNTGALIGVLQQAKMIPSSGDIPRLNKVLFADSVASIFGALLGTSSTGSFIESTTGVRAGGRTGLTAVIVGLLFLIALFVEPLAKSVPSYATAAALLYVAGLMSKSLLEINRRNILDIVPAIITTVAIPATFSIAYGIILGFVSYFILLGLKRLCSMRT